MKISKVFLEKAGRVFLNYVLPFVLFILIVYLERNGYDFNSDILFAWILPLSNVIASLVSMILISIAYRRNGWLPNSAAFVFPFLFLSMVVYLAFIFRLLDNPALFLRPALLGLLMYPAMAAYDYFKLTSSQRA